MAWRKARCTLCLARLKSMPTPGALRFVLFPMLAVSYAEIQDWGDVLWSVRPSPPPPAARLLCRCAGNLTSEGKRRDELYLWFVIA